MDAVGNQRVEARPLMCLPTLGEIKKIIEKDGSKIALVDFAGLLKEIDLALAPDSKIGDYIIAHGNFAVRKIATDEARETLEILKKSCTH